MNYNNLFLKCNLPDPLTKEELNKYLKLCKEGNKEAKNIIVNHNIKLVLSRVIERFKTMGYDNEELVSVGLIGLLKSIDGFDINRETNFVSFAVKCIDNEILMFIRKEKKFIYCDSFEKTLMINDEREIKIKDVLADITADFIPKYEYKELLINIRRLVEQLKEPDRQIVMLYFGFDSDKRYRQMELSQMFNISRPQISRCISKNAYKIGCELREMGLIDKVRQKVKY